MKIRIAFRGMEHSNAMEEYASNKMVKLEKFLQKEPEPLYVDLVLEAARQHHHHKVEIRINSKHHHIMVHSEGPDLYLQIDATVDKAVHEAKKDKERMLDARNHPKDHKKYE
jgi:ribosomal subunit interface protein